jgi:hypothetical protein
MASKFTFLPDARSALVAAASDPAAGVTRRNASLSVAVTANGAVAGTPVALSAELLDAGDVIAVDPRMIARVDPRPAATAFEPNYMPLIEFVDADFPWRYSLDTGTPGVASRGWCWWRSLRMSSRSWIRERRRCRAFAWHSLRARCRISRNPGPLRTCTCLRMAQPRRSISSCAHIRSATTRASCVRGSLRPIRVTRCF